jgi:phosphoglycerol transferase MdoB-like AlkP superfamily enzyme
MKRWLAGVITIAATFLLTFAFVWVVSVALRQGDDAVRLPLLIIAAVIGLLAAIGFVVVAFSLFKLINPDQPLGLPEGSVRALLALLILVIFAAMTIFFFGAMRTKPTADPAAVSAASDLAKQVITMLGTLLTAIASFYFGSQSATSAATKVAAATTAPLDPSNSPSAGETEAIDRGPRKPASPPRPDGFEEAE